MWFGDLVTMRWFNDVWMKEVFANFMAAKIVNPSFPDVNHELRFLLVELSRPPTASIAPPAPTRSGSELDNLNEAGTLYGAIIYQKAPIVMRQLETLIGADAFRDGLREYLKQFSFGNATWLDLVRRARRPHARDLAAWSHAWVEEGGRPTIDTPLDARRSDGRSAASSSHSRSARERTLRWTEKLQVLVSTAEG